MTLLIECVTWLLLQSCLWGGCARTAHVINSGVAQRLACWAHNSKVRGSKPRPAIFSVLRIRNIDMCAHNSVRAWACCTEVAGGNRGQPRGARRGSNSGRCGCNHRPCLNHCAALSFVRGRWDAATLSSNQCHAKLCSGTRPLAPCEGLFRRAMVAQTSRWLPVALPVQPHADIPTTMTAAPGVQQWRGAAR